MPKKGDEVGSVGGNGVLIRFVTLVIDQEKGHRTEEGGTKCGKMGKIGGFFECEQQAFYGGVLGSDLYLS